MVSSHTALEEDSSLILHVRTAEAGHGGYTYGPSAEGHWSRSMRH